MKSPSLGKFNKLKNDQYYDLYHERLIYNSSDGTFVWKCINDDASINAKMFNTRFANKQAFTSKDFHGYCQSSIKIKGKQVRMLAHRVAWTMTYGNIPLNKDIDHINGDKSNNRIINLRLVTKSENNKNQHRVRSNNTSGVTGVYWCASRNKWISRININGETKTLLRSMNFDEAVEARRLAELRNGYYMTGESP